MNITGGSSLGLFEVNEAAEIISQAADSEANIIFGSVIDERMEDEVRVTVIATGFDQKLSEAKERRSSKQSQSQQPDLEVVKPFSNHDDLDIPAFLRRR